MLHMLSKLDKLEREFNRYLPEEKEEITDTYIPWHTIARKEQLPPDDPLWSIWLYLAGRGAGKTRTGAEWVNKLAYDFPNCRIALVARTEADGRDVMVEGESGIVSSSSVTFKPRYSKHECRIDWPNGSKGFVYSAEQPDKLRGPQHHFAWCDEFAAWRNRQKTWDMLRMGLRLGEHPKTFISTTPQPFELLTKIMEAETTRVSRSSTFANAKNLAEPFLEELKRNYLGTRLGRQELEGEILSDTPGALWKRSQLDEIRVFSIPKCKKIVVAIDPAVTTGENSDETGLIVAGLKDDNTYIVLADYSGKYEPNAWATIAIKAWEVWKADLIVAEVNNGGDMVGSIIYNINNKPAYKKVTASRGKRTRAEPIAMLYEQKKVFHYCENDNFQELVDQMCSWNPSLEREQKSPDRVDALVWALTELSEGSFTAPIGKKFDDFIKSMPKSRF